MYGCTTVSIFIVVCLVLSTGFTVASSNFSFLQKFSNCTGKDLSVSVKCLVEEDRETHPLYNRSSCCFFSLYNSSHPSEACDSKEQGNMSTYAKASESTARPDSDLFRLRTCEGSNVQLLCEINVSCPHVVRWRTAGGATIFRRTLHLPNVQKEDAREYICEVTDTIGRVKQQRFVNIEVQFPPVIIVPNSSVSNWTELEETLECQSEASPRPTITWYRDGVLLSPAPSLYEIASDNNTDCITTSFVFFKMRNASSNSSDDMVLDNFTCVAENELGKATATFLLASYVEEPLPPEEERRQFNVTGFILGMLPPLFISFYIIMKLGYKSRYAPERPEDEGYHDPFFINF